MLNCKKLTQENLSKNQDEPNTVETLIASHMNKNMISRHL